MQPQEGSHPQAGSIEHPPQEDPQHDDRRHLLKSFDSKPPPQPLEQEGAAHPQAGSQGAPQAGSHDEQLAGAPQAGSQDEQPAGAPQAGSQELQPAGAPQVGSQLEQPAGAPHAGSHDEQPAGAPHAGSHTSQQDDEQQLLR